MRLKNPLSGLIHLIGAILAIPAMVILIILGTDSVWKIVSFSVYGGFLLLLYIFSTLYHWLPKSAGGRFQLFRKLDHLAIYAFIAGTYTPFCLVPLRGPIGWTLFGIIWGFALFAIVLQTIYIDLPRWLTTSLYIMMGWLIVLAVNPLIANLGHTGFNLILAGGIIYSIGGVFYTIRKPNLSSKFGYHELWHIMVLLGSICHFLVMLLFIA